MIENIGEVAGKIWQYLNENGASSSNQIALNTKINKNDIQRAIGWLLKEDKLLIEMKKKTEMISLK